MHDTVPLTFDLDSGLALISSCDVADYTQVSPLVLEPNVFYLQSPITVGLKAIPLEAPLSVFRPVGEDP